MRNSKIVKITLAVLTVLIIGMLVNTPILAANNTSESSFEDLTAITNNSTTNNTTTNKTNNTVLNTNSVNNTTKNTTNNTSLPKTGVEDSLPIGILVVVFGISAIYAYRKVKDYRDL